MADLPLIVTGAGGRIGRLLCRLWKDQTPTGLLPVFLTRSEWDIEQDDAPHLGLAPGLVLDLAAGRGDRHRVNPDLADRVSAFAQQHGHRLIHMSSGAVYPGGVLPQHEDMTPMPHSAYGQSKLRAEKVVQSKCPGSLILRLGNVAGADALLGAGRGRDADMVLLDPISSGDRGPIRSYIGPITLARTIGRICSLAAEGKLSFQVLNVAQPNPVAMADLLDADERRWMFGPSRIEVLERMVLSTDRLQGHMPIASATAHGLVAELRQLGCWP